jgi:hypothetical protein
LRDDRGVKAQARTRTGAEADDTEFLGVCIDRASVHVEAGRDLSGRQQAAGRLGRVPEQHGHLAGDGQDAAWSSAGSRATATSPFQAEIAVTGSLEPTLAGCLGGGPLERCQRIARTSADRLLTSRPSLELGSQLLDGA